MQSPPASSILIDADFLSCLCHELRGSVQIIEGFGDLLLTEERSLSPGQRSKLEVILRNSNYLLVLMQDIEELARLGKNRVKLTINEVALAPLLQECVDNMAAVAARKEITVRLEDDLPPLRVAGDPQRLRQVLTNLVTNAIKYNRSPGDVLLSWARTGCHHVRIMVRDTGPGIAEELREEVFKPFTRLGMEQSGILGSGIGLAITKELVERMGGHVGFESRVGEGSVFWFELPQPEEDHLAAPVHHETGWGGGGGAACQGEELGKFRWVAKKNKELL